MIATFFCIGVKLSVIFVPRKLLVLVHNPFNEIYIITSSYKNNEVILLMK